MINLSKLFGSKIDFKKLMEDGALLIDVRTPDEYKAGHVAASQNIPLDTIPAHIARIKTQNKPVITICRSGARSGVAAGMLKNAGIDVYNGGGWMDFERSLK